MLICSLQSAPAPAPAPAPASGPAPKLGLFESPNYDYKFSKGAVDSTWGQSYIVTTKNYGLGKLDSIAINEDKHSIAVMEAWNNKETLLKTDPRKATLSDIEANLYVESGGNLNDLSLLYHSAILEDSKADARPGPDMYQTLLDVKKAMTGDEGYDGTLTLKQDSKGVEQDSFNKILGTKFPKGINRMIAQYSIKNPQGSAKQITQFDITLAEDMGPTYNDLYAYLA